ncbi:MAG: hypothetical protein NUW37_15530 [Planctomycetes bacterium]|nr:hypothetical protein [Planctomycetota bacterium]
MKRVPTSLLSPSPALPGAIFHISGKRLFQEGEPFHPEYVQLLMGLEVTSVMVFESSENADAFIREAAFESLPLDKMKASHQIGLPVYTEDGRLLVQQGTWFNSLVRRTLEKYNIHEVMVLREDSFAQDYKKFLEEKRAIAQKVRARAIGRLSIKNVKELLRKDLDLVREAQRESASGTFGDEPAGEPLSRLIDTRPHETPRQELEKAEYVETFRFALERMTEFYDKLRAGGEADSKDIEDISNDVVVMLVKDKDLLLNLVNSKVFGADLAVHVVKTAIVAINVAAALGYSSAQVMEICIGALLSDIGMVKVPKDVLEKHDKLSNDDRKVVSVHPTEGVKLLKNISSLPKSVLFSVYQAHERCDGSGYPLGHSPDKIHMFAKIIGAADTYSAMTSPRPYRGAKLPYEAVEELVRLVSMKRFDNKVVRAMLIYFSLFPVGSWVELSTGFIGRVVAADPKNFARPMVLPIFKSRGKLQKLQNQQIVELSKRSDISILKAIDSVGLPEIELMTGF